MTVLDRFLGELQTLQHQTALDSLTTTPESEKTAFGFGRAVGRLEGLRLAGELLEKLLREQELKDSGVSRRGRGQKAEDPGS